MLAAVAASVTGFRHVYLTAAAMIIAMLPTGLGEGAEQNAPLGRAVIGGPVWATCATLLFVPVVLSIIHGRRALGNKKGPPARPEDAYV